MRANGTAVLVSLVWWCVVVVVMAVFVELGFRAFDHEWDIQQQRTQQMRDALER